MQLKKLITKVKYLLKRQVCDDACTLGKEMQIPVYKFVKQALIRKFGEEWYLELEEFAQSHFTTKGL